MNKGDHSIRNYYYWSRDDWWTTDPRFKMPKNFDEIVKIHNRLIDTFAEKHPEMDLNNMRDRLEFSAYDYQQWDNFFFNGFIVDAEGYFFFENGQVVDIHSRPLNVEMILAKYD